MEPNSQLVPFVSKFFDYDPLTATHALETMDRSEAVRVLTELPPSIAAKIFKHLQVDFASDLLEAVPPETLKEIVEHLDPQQGAMIFLDIKEELRLKLLEHLSDKNKKQIQELLTYPRGSVGSIMSTDFLAFRNNIKTIDAVNRIKERSRSKAPPASYVYVVDSENHLVGILNMRDLLVGDDHDPLESIMIKSVFTIDAFMQREDAANELSSRKYFAAPVVDAENHLLGIVKADQLINQAQEEASEDILKMFGVGSDERAFSPLSFSLKKRLPWLHINLATAFLAASVVALFEGIIAKITVLAVFLPIVAGQGGNAGSQSLAVVMRGLVMREISPRESKKMLLKEGKIGLLNGFVIGIVTALIAWLWKGNPYLGLVIGLAMIVNLVAAGLSGAFIPLTLKALGQDPAQSSSIILTTVTDVVGFFAFLGFAVIFQNLLI
ncbi:MAG: magnesium transporter [Candidatus Dadabacteria bacterium]|nr:magnesium transporter [Candidatus Dadabacteria bacterium]NIS07679.1 magnesium transporter [Candidatus Dadabacteria bacterium]NIV42258.1 magnesium transporter [Candidatus Dadabacteria bacterium]NIX14765.1 magnesium transporter [Candidatus Dadabacteria bacterium]NIY21306.1 magnesium transporter [Candidatus Dadabacteria bacterium]